MALLGQCVTARHYASMIYHVTAGALVGHTS